MKRLLLASLVLALVPTFSFASDRYYHGGGYHGHSYGHSYGHYGHGGHSYFDFSVGFGGYRPYYYHDYYYARPVYRTYVAPPVYYYDAPVYYDAPAPRYYYRDYDDCYYRPSFNFSFGYSGRYYHR